MSEPLKVDKKYRISYHTPQTVIEVIGVFKSRCKTPIGEAFFFDCGMFNGSGIFIEDYVEPFNRKLHEEGPRNPPEPALRIERQNPEAGEF